ncbi:hypothetical protein ACOIDR_28525, partial [Klebsiella pneumoniae]|uniref:hypothetical protein n=1 Tax=Klebsiella pneumoniae TaxID=573 RepID=UPI003B5CABCF
DQQNDSSQDTSVQQQCSAKNVNSQNPTGDQAERANQGQTKDQPDANAGEQEGEQTVQSKQPNKAEQSEDQEQDESQPQSGSAQ